MKKKVQITTTIKNDDLLPLYVRKAKFLPLIDENQSFRIRSDGGYQIEKHPNVILYKPILLLYEEI